MAENIENYLLEKLDHAIKESSDQLNLVGKIAPLKTQFKDVKKLLENKTNPTNSGSAEEWFRVRRENLYYLNNVLTEWQMISKKHTSYSLTYQISARKQIAASLAKIKKELKVGESIHGKIKKELKSGESSHGKSTSSHGQQETTNGGTNTIPETSTYRWSSRHGPRKVRGLKDNAMSMERQLVSNAPFKAIGIVGMAGIGKTTLCQLVFSRPKVRETFLPRIWVCLSKQPKDNPQDNRKEIVMRILRSLGVEDGIINNANTETDGLKRLIFALRLQLMGKKYLIVLDDAYEKGDFYENLSSGFTLDDGKWGEELKYGLPKGSGGTVIVSSREEAITKKMVGEEYLHYLKPVSDENCWKIFIDATVEDKKDLPEPLQELKKEILKKCDGLPLAAKLLGQIAKEQGSKKEDVSDFAGAGENDQENQQNGIGEAEVEQAESALATKLPVQIAKEQVPKKEDVPDFAGRAGENDQENQQNTTGEAEVEQEKSALAAKLPEQIGKEQVPKKEEVPKKSPNLVGAGKNDEENQQKGTGEAEVEQAEAAKLPGQIAKEQVPKKEEVPEKSPNLAGAGKNDQENQQKGTGEAEVEQAEAAKLPGQIAKEQVPKKEEVSEKSQNLAGAGTNDQENQQKGTGEAEVEQAEAAKFLGQIAKEQVPKKEEVPEKSQNLAGAGKNDQENQQKGTGKAEVEQAEAAKLPEQIAKEQVPKKEEVLEKSPNLSGIGEEINPGTGE